MHNTRIERLWYDVTHGYGQKWKNFFITLELHHGLDPMQTACIWLLHHLFLSKIQEDAEEWAAGWNSHKMQIRHQTPQSPREMFVFSMVHDGPRGMTFRPEPPSEDVPDIAAYGIDWEVANDHRLMNHLLQENPQDWSEDNPFAGAPATLSHVPCEPPNCPLTPQQVESLDQALAERVDVTSRSMDTRRLVWIEALNICRHFMEVN